MAKQDEKPVKKAKIASEPTARASKAGAGAEGGVKKARKKKDKNAPKRGMSAFMFFSNDKRESVKTEHPGIAFGEVGKILGQKWKELTEEDKKPYEAMAEKDKARYEKEKAAYEGRAPGDNGVKAEDAEVEEAGDETSE